MKNLNAILTKTAKKLNKTEDELLKEIQSVCSLIANQINFAYYDRDDIEQEGLIIALESLKKYDFKRPLANFIYIDVRNRILNLKRKIVTRTDPPCLSCHQSIDGFSEHEGGKHCEKYKRWYSINFSKKSLSKPLQLEEKQITYNEEDSVGDHAELKDLLKQIDRALPVELRSTYLRMRAGEDVEPDKKVEVENFILEIVNDD